MPGPTPPTTCRAPGGSPVAATEFGAAAAVAAERPFQTGEIRDNTALVTELNTRWDESQETFLS